MKTKITEYGENRTVELNETELYCPTCGKQNVWIDVSEPEEYYGYSFYCLSCSTKHYLDGSTSMDEIGEENE